MAEKSELIRADIVRTREEMGETLDALAYKADVRGRSTGWVVQRKDRFVGACGSFLSRASGATDSMLAQVSGMTRSGSDGLQAGAEQMKETAERKPLAVPVAGAAVGFVLGLLAPSTDLEDERLGPAADQVKSTVAEAGQAAVEHGKDVAQATAESAAQTAKEQGRQHAEELTSSLTERAGQTAPVSSTSGAAKMDE